MNFKPFKAADNTKVVESTPTAATELQTPPTTSSSSKDTGMRERSASVSYDVIRLLKTWYNDGSNKYTPEDIAVAVQQIVAQKKYSSNLRRFLFVSFFFLIISLAVLITGIVYGVQQLKQTNVDEFDTLLNPKDGKPLRVQQHYQYLLLQDLNVLPLEQVEKLESLVLQWGEDGSEDEIKYYYNVESASRKGKHGTYLKLSSGHSLLVMAENALLHNEKGEVIGELKFNVEPEEEEEDVESDETVSSESDVEIGGSSNSKEKDEAKAATEGTLLSGSADTEANRRLRKKNLFGKYPKNATPRKPKNWFDAICRYGCGKLALTFPYFQRPFFGYGYPLVGTEAMFPSGYGGNPTTQVMAANAGLGSVAARNTPVLSSGVPVAPGVPAQAPPPMVF